MSSRESDRTTWKDCLFRAVPYLAFIAIGTITLIPFCVLTKIGDETAAEISKDERSIVEKVIDTESTIRLREITAEEKIGLAEATNPDCAVPCKQDDQQLCSDQGSTTSGETTDCVATKDQIASGTNAGDPIQVDRSEFDSIAGLSGWSYSRWLTVAIIFILSVIPLCIALLSLYAWSNKKSDDGNKPTNSGNQPGGGGGDPSEKGKGESSGGSANTPGNTDSAKDKPASFTAREPAITIAAGTALLQLLIIFGFQIDSAEQASIITGLTALAGVIISGRVRAIKT